MIIWASASTLAAPPMSFFISSMPLSGLMSRPPVSKHTPLPTSVTLGAAGSPQFMSIRRGARAAARPTAWISGKFARQQIVADDVTLMPAPWRAASAVAASASSAGPHVVRGRIDEVAGQIDGLGDTRQFGAVRLLRHLQAHFVGGFAVADESVGSERNRDGGEPLVMGRIGEAVNSARQQTRERAGKKGIEGFRRVFQSKQHRGERPIGPGKQGMPCRRRLEPGGLGERAGPRVEACADVAPGRGGHEPDRNGCGAAAGHECRVHGWVPETIRPLLPRHPTELKEVRLPLRSACSAQAARGRRPRY